LSLVAIASCCGDPERTATGTGGAGIDHCGEHWSVAAWVWRPAAMIAAAGLRCVLWRSCCASRQGPRASCKPALPSCSAGLRRSDGWPTGPRARRCAAPLARGRPLSGIAVRRPGKRSLCRWRRRPCPSSLTVATRRRDTGAAFAALDGSIAIGAVHSAHSDPCETAAPGGAGAQRPESSVSASGIGGRGNARRSSLRPAGDLKGEGQEGKGFPCARAADRLARPLRAGRLPRNTPRDLLHISRRGRARRPWP
jgi:hypothetical protein